MKRSIEESLFDPEMGCEFDPYQAVRLLELLANDPPAGPWREVEAAVRFRANVSLAFPPSLIAQIIPPAPPGDGPRGRSSWLGPPTGPAPDEPAGLRPTAAAVRGRYKRADVPVLV